MLAFAAESDEATWSNIKTIRLEGEFLAAVVAWRLSEVVISAYDVGQIECMVAFAVQIVTFVILAWYKSAVSPG